MSAIKRAIGQTCVFDYYDIKEKLGKGKYATVHAGVHKKTGEEVAIKILSKKNANHTDLAAFHQEINMMKVC